MANKIQLQRSYKRIIQIELNEISRPIIDLLISQGNLPNFDYINRNWSYYQTTSETKYEHIEPWIQWVTAHTGKTFAEHQIFHLSDIENLQHPQIWELLSKAGIESCIVSSMNAIRRDTNGGVFIPDPWAKEATAYPAALQPLYRLINKKVQTHATQSMGLTELANAFSSCIKLKIPVAMYFKIAHQILRQKFDVSQRWRLAGIFDEFLFYIFKNLLKQNYQFNTLFLNSIAHYQHNYWRNFQPELFNSDLQAPDCRIQDNPIVYGFNIYDKLLADFIKLSKEPDTLVVIASGFSQNPYTQDEEKGGMNYYRLIDHKKFATRLGLTNALILPLMSRDWQVKHDSEEYLSAIIQKVEGVTVSGEQVFSVSRDAPQSLFIETKLTRKVKPDEVVKDNSGASLGVFSEIFKGVTIKSGYHIQEGSLWLSEPCNKPYETADIVPLTSLFDLALDNFGITEMAQ